MLRFYFDSSDQLELGNTEISQIENSVYKEVHEDMNLWYGGKLCFKDRLRQLHKIQLHIQGMQGQQYDSESIQHFMTNHAPRWIPAEKKQYFISPARSRWKKQEQHNIHKK